MQKEFRLKSERSFNVIYRRGKSVSDATMVVICLKSKYDNLKVGFSVGKKVGNSVTRNLIKRRLRESFRRLIPSIDKGYSFIVVAKKPIVDIDYLTIGNNLITLLSRLGRINNK